MGGVKWILRKEENCIIYEYEYHNKIQKTLSSLEKESEILLAVGTCLQLSMAMASALIESQPYFT